MPATPAATPASAVTITVIRPTGKPAMRAARALPPTIRAAKPKVVRRISNQARTQAIRPSARPQWTSMPGRLPIRSASGSGRVDGLLRLAESRIGPSTTWFITAMAIDDSSNEEMVSLTPRQRRNAPANAISPPPVAIPTIAITTCTTIAGAP
jgi:hypothetical protein